LCLLGFDAIDKCLTVRGGKCLTEIRHGPFFDGGKDGVVRTSCVEIVHPGFECVQDTETDRELDFFFPKIEFSV